MAKKFQIVVLDVRFVRRRVDLGRGPISAQPDSDGRELGKGKIIKLPA